VNLFGIVQGGTDERLRRRSAEATCALPCAGFALGGFSVGEAREATREGIACSAPLLPADKPRYLMGMGEPADLLHAMARGLDLADCTLPTRNGRNATVFTSEGRLRLRNARYARDDRPLDLRCRCYACRNFSRAFLRHLFLAREMNAAILASLHNAAFYQALMADSRAAIREGKFAEFRSRFEARYAPADDAAAEDADSGP
jgi:queuine tRNA-ribosyltransferase